MFPLVFFSFPDAIHSLKTDGPEFLSSAFKLGNTGHIIIPRIITASVIKVIYEQVFGFLLFCVTAIFIGDTRINDLSGAYDCVISFIFVADKKNKQVRVCKKGPLDWKIRSSFLSSLISVNRKQEGI